MPALIFRDKRAGPTAEGELLLGVLVHEGEGALVAGGPADFELEAVTLWTVV